MEIVKRISVDLNQKGSAPVVDAVQGDSARWLEIALLLDLEPWEIPDGITILVRYLKPDGTGGVYDTLPDGTEAWHVEGNIVKLALAPQVCAVPGAVLVQAVLVQGEQQISTFHIALRVSSEVAGGEESQDYTNLAKWLEEYGGAGGYAHVENRNNPHSVTKTQVGLGNVDNTSDMDKPVSRAQQTALDGKQPNLGFTPVQQGGGTDQRGNKIKIGWNTAGTELLLEVDTHHIGAFAMKENICPVGSIYLSVNTTSPASFFGGTWEQIRDVFLLAASSSAYPVGSTGGEATHTLTVNEMPSHSHDILNNGKYLGAHGGGDAGSSGITIDIQSRSNAFNTTKDGGGAAHNNMPPYLAVYMWKRTA